MAKRQRPLARGPQPEARRAGRSRGIYHAGVLNDYTNATPESVTAAIDEALAAADLLTGAVSRSVANPTFDATLRPLELAGAAIADGYGRGAFLAQVHPDAAVRDAGHAGNERLTKWRVAVAFREDLYLAVAAFAATPEAAQLSGERRLLLDHWLRDFRRAGFELSAPERAELEALRNRLVELEVAFQRNINDSNDAIEVTREQLDGLPDAYVERLSPGEQPGTYRVSLDYPEVNPFMAQATNRPLRERLFRMAWNQAADVNRPLLEEAVGLRRQIAAILGKPTWAHHVLDLRMAATPERVQAFYAELVPPLEAAAREEIAELTALMERDGHGGPVQGWDWSYYDTRLTRERHGVDQNEVSEYLPLEPVIEGMFALTGEVLGITYHRVEPVSGWHQSVQLYEIRDAASGESLAHFYTDLFPREGKYNHAAAFPIVIGHRRADGSYARPVSAIVANLTPPSPTGPSLLRHGPGGEVETLFHEFGHILHMCLTRAEFTRFSGGETEWDFVEAPSQIMEHWTWEPEVLARFARHHVTGEPIPRELAKRLVAARYVDVGLRAARQVFFGTMDMAIHASAAPPDLDAAMEESYAVTQLPYPDGTFMLAAFGHLMGGYDAGYYGYLWAEVIGDDMWGRFADEGIASPVVGAAYRRAILEPNGTRTGDELVAAFLGRQASVENYLRMRGLLPVGVDA